MATRRPKAESKKNLPDVDRTLSLNPLHDAGVKTGAWSESFIASTHGAQKGGVPAHGEHFFAAFLAFGQVRGCRTTLPGAVRFRKHLFEVILN